VFSAAGIAIVAFAGASGIGMMIAAAGAGSTALVALITQLGLIPPLMAYVGGTMTGGAAAMAGFAAAGKAVVAMLGGWPVVVAAAAAGIGLLVSRIVSASDEANAAALRARGEAARISRQFAEARNAVRVADPNIIMSEIAAQEAFIRRLTRANSENSIVVIAARGHLSDLRAEYDRVTGATKNATDGAQAYNDMLSQQVQKVREQVAEAKGGAVAALAARAASVDWTKSTAQQGFESLALAAELKALNAELDATKSKTAAGEAATRAAADAMNDARAAAGRAPGVAPSPRSHQRPAISAMPERSVAGIACSSGPCCLQPL
jgi:hypothetical protein